MPQHQLQAQAGLHKCVFRSAIRKFLGWNHLEVLQLGKISREVNARLSDWGNVCSGRWQFFSPKLRKATVLLQVVAWQSTILARMSYFLIYIMQKVALLLFDEKAEIDS